MEGTFSEPSESPTDRRPPQHPEASQASATEAGRDRKNGHRTLLYADHAGRMDAVASFFKRGRSRDERCLYVVAENTKAEIIDALRERGLDAEAAVEGGGLVLRTAEEIYLEDGGFAPDRALDFWNEEFTARPGDTGRRVTAEMGWIRDAAVDHEQLATFEADVNLTVADADLNALCQYDRTSLPDEYLVDVLQTHPVVVADGTSSVNPHSRTPEGVSTANPPSIDPARAIDRLQEPPAVEPQAGESHGGATSQGTHIHLCLSDGRNQRLLADWLGDQYDSVTTADAPTNLDERGVDLCILDARTFSHHRETLLDQKQPAESPLLPYLVVTQESTVPDDPTIRTYVDELITMPTEKETLAWRIETLLRMRSLSRELARKNRRLEHLAKAAAHDLRNPLSVAQGYLDLMEEGEEKDTIAASLDRMEGLIEKVLAIANTDKPPENRNIESVDLASLVGEGWEVVPTQHATLESTVAPDRTIRAEPALLRQLLENLFLNAVEHAGDDVHVRVGEIDDGRGFYVADDGPGIPEDERGEVFEDDYSTASGSGLGLAVVKRVARYHNWSVYLTESDAGGARFEILRFDLSGDTPR
ncbi:MAG: MEDS domain-containing protein [Halodesulfurarchaeum sp.]